MKKLVKIASFILSVLLASSLFAGCSQQKEGDVPSGMKLASGEDADYLMYVPENWRVDKSTLYTSAYYSSGDATSVSATAYGMNFDDTTVDDWFEGFLKEFKEIYTDVSQPEKADAKLGGVDGRRYTFSGTLNGTVYDYIIVAVINRNYVYYITYTSTPQYYSAHLEELENVISNFEFKK